MNREALLLCFCQHPRSIAEFLLFPRFFVLTCHPDQVDQPSRSERGFPLCCGFGLIFSLLSTRHLISPALKLHTCGGDYMPPIPFHQYSLEHTPTHCSEALHQSPTSCSSELLSQVIGFSLRHSHC